MYDLRRHSPFVKENLEEDFEAARAEAVNDCLDKGILERALPVRVAYLN
jgi:hypothetical protein